MNALVKAYLKFQSGLKLKSSEKRCILSVIGLVLVLFVLRSYAPEAPQEIGFWLFSATLVWLVLVAVVGVWSVFLITSAIVEHLRNARRSNSQFGKFLNWIMANDR